MGDPLQRINAAVIDGRCRTPRYVQKQLSTLHAALVQESSNLHLAILKDTGWSSAEAWLEVHMTVQAVKDQYEAIDLKDCLQQEYSIAYGKRNLDRRLPYGAVYIVPCKHNRLYSIIQPAVAAIAAGNCVVVEMGNTLLAAEKILRHIIQQKMDKDTFVLIDQRASGSQLSDAQTIFCNTEDGQTPEGFSRSLQSSSSNVVAVVDRSADISAAAETIVRARIFFNGKSPYAPDVVLVNEFVMKEFCQASIKALTKNLSDVSSSASPGLSSKGIVRKTSHDFDAKTLISTDRGSIEIVSNRDESLLARKVDEPRLLIVPISSLDDAIDFANSTAVPLLAAYFFADTKAAKYLSQFTGSELSLTNFVPLHLLVGPAAPQGHPVSLRTRFTKEMFSFPSPEHIAPANSSSASEIEALELALCEQHPPPKIAVETLKASIRTPLTDMGQSPGKSIGFFEQGLFTGASIVGVVLVSSLAVTAKFAAPAILRRFR